MNIIRKYPKVFKVNSKPNFILIYQTILKQIRLSGTQTFYSVEIGELRITQNCLELDNKKQVSLTF